MEHLLLLPRLLPLFSPAPVSLSTCCLPGMRSSALPNTSILPAKPRHFFRYQITIQIQVVPRKLLGYQRELQAKCKPPISKSAYSIIAFYSSSFKNIDNSNNKIPWQFKSAFSCIVNTALLSEVPDTLLHLILEVLRIFGNRIVAKCWTVVTLMTTRGQSLTANDSKASHPGLSFWCWS